MTLDQLKIIFEHDDLNPDAELVFHDDTGNMHTIDDVADGDNDNVLIFLRRKS